MNEFKRKVNLKAKGKHIESKKRLASSKRNSTKEMRSKPANNLCKDDYCSSASCKNKEGCNEDQNEIHGHLIEGVTQATGLENEIVKLIEQKITLDKENELHVPKESENKQQRFQPAAVALPIQASTEICYDLNLLPRQELQDEGKKTLVLDLDETLIHSVFKPVEGADMILKIPEQVSDRTGNTYTVMNDIYVYKRPGVDMFLKRLSRYYELVIFTASIDKYANPVIDSLDANNLTRHRLYREHCTYMYNVFIKDLK